MKKNRNLSFYRLRHLLVLLSSLCMLILHTTFASAMSDADVEAKVNALLSNMSLAEKTGQLELQDWGFYGSAEKLDEAKQMIREGKIGGFLNIPRNWFAPDAFDELQKVAVEEGPNGIPILFGHDVIHGYKTIFPIPLGQAASWNTDLVTTGARVAAEEATAAGIRWTFAPMIDISRDPRWGRIAESLGEDPYLTSVLGAAMVKGFQGGDLSNPTSMAACPKHFIGYGAAEGGRDYNTSYIPEGLLRDIYLPPFKAAIDAGAPTIMSSYNELNGVPATGNKRVLTDILKDEWGFNGFVVSDWNSILEMIPHGFARDDKHAAELAANAGVDFEMHTTTYREYLPALIKEGKYTQAQLDDAVKRILRVKVKLGLFENPYVDKARRDNILNEDFLAKSKQAAIESFVLLKNDENLLPISPKKKVAIIGPLAEVPYQQMGTWVYEGEKKHSRTLLPAVKQLVGDDSKITYVPGLPYSRSKDTSGFNRALAATKDSDVILFFGGEEAILSGEGHSRGDISLPGAQEQLIHELASTGKPLVLIILAGRPITLEGILDKVDSVMMAWHPGTMAGPALADVIYGNAAPSGRLPVTWPKGAGQIPVYYNHKATGRPATDDNYTRIDKIDPGVEFQHDPGNSSNHLDYGHTPEFPFGYGLTYSNVRYDKVKINKKKIKLGDDLTVTARVKNTGKVETTEVVQLYVQDVVGDVTRPVKELKGFSRVTLKPGESQKVVFTIHTDDLAFHNQAMEKVTEPGLFKVWVAQHAADNTHALQFEVR